jgi:hypothetical protein
MNDLLAHGWAPPPPVAASGARGRDGVAARPRWKGTIAVALIVACVALGGVAADNAIPEPSAGRVAISTPIYMTAGPGWVATNAAGGVTDGVELQKSNALFVAQVISAEYDGDARQLLDASKEGFQHATARVTFGNDRDIDLNGKQASVVTFSALFSDGGGSGVIDGEIVCMVLHSGGQAYAVFIQAGAPQSYLASITGEIEAMAGSVRVGP